MKTNPCLLGIIGALLSLPPLAHAATKTWNGGGADNFWTNAANWGGTAPVAGDDLVFADFGVDDSSYDNTNTFPNKTPFPSITLGRGDYVLNGAAVSFTNAGATAINATNASGLNTINFTFLFDNQPQTIACVSSNAVLQFNASADLGPVSLTANCGGQIQFSGSLGGGTGLTKTGTGKLVLNSAVNNFYAGTTTVNGGTVELNGASPMIPGPLVINAGATVTLLAANQIGFGTAGAVTVVDTGLLNLNGFSDGIGALTVTGGDVTTGAGTLTLDGDVTANASTKIATISGNLSLGSATRTFSIGNGAANPDLTISAVISGDAGVGITKAGLGVLRFSGSNTYSGVTTLNSAPALQVYNPSALGSTSSGTTLAGGGGLYLNAVTVAGETLTSTGVSSVLQSDGAAGWSGNVVLNTTLQIQVASGTNDISGAISGAGGLTKTQPGTLILSGTNDNTYAGTTTVSTGTFLLNKSSSGIAIPGPLVINAGATVTLLAASQIGFGTAGAVTVDGSGLLNLNGFSDGIGSLTLTDGGDVATGAGTLTLGGDVTATGGSPDTCTISGNLSLGTATRTITVNDNFLSDPDLEITANISSVGVGLIKAGLGQLRLNGTNTYIGPTVVNEGELELNRASGPALAAGGSLTVGDGSGFDLVTLTVGTNQLPDTLPIRVNDGAIFRAFNSNEAVGPVTLNGGTVTTAFSPLFVSNVVTLASANSASLRGLQKLYGPGSRALFDVANGAADSDLVVQAELSGSTAAMTLVKTNAGTMLLNGTCTYSNLLISQGTVLVNSNHLGSVQLDGGTLGGTGSMASITATLAGGSVLSPGASVGTLRCGSLTLNSSVTSVFELTPTNNDRIEVSGLVQLSGTLQVVLLGTPFAGASYTLINNDGAGAIGGPGFNGLAEGAYFSVGGTTLRITYSGGSGNDVVLLRTNAPPATISSVISLANGFTQLQGSGLAGLTYSIEAASNLNPVIVWTPLGTAVANGSGVFSFTDTNASSFPMRFYRALSP